MLEDGAAVKHTRTNRTLFRAVSEDFRPNEIMYLHPEDAARVLLNKIPNREILIQRLFRDRQLDPKEGMFLAGDSAIGARREDLVIPTGELARFAKDAGIKINRTTRHELDIPWRSWYDRPIGRTGLAILGVVAAGMIMMWIRGEF
jgi:hypothetical protein